MVAAEYITGLLWAKPHQQEEIGATRYMGSDARVLAEE